MKTNVKVCNKKSEVSITIELEPRKLHNEQKISIDTKQAKRILREYLEKVGEKINLTKDVRYDIITNNSERNKNVGTWVFKFEKPQEVLKQEKTTKVSTKKSKTKKTSVKKTKKEE